jgi:hypothetical protein
VPGELRILEEEAFRVRMAPEELSRIRAIGKCPAQVRTRVTMLQALARRSLGLA